MYLRFNYVDLKLIYIYIHTIYTYNIYIHTIYTSICI